MLRKFVKKAKKAKRGFTLIELIVVIAILAILSAVLVPVIGNSITSARTSAAKSDANALFEAATLYQANSENSNPSVNPFTASEGTTLTDATKDPLLTMFGSTYFATMPASKFTSFIITIDANGTISKTSVTESGITATYP